MGKVRKKRKVWGAGYCDCKPLNGDPAPRPNTLICSYCGFSANVVPTFTAREISDAAMKRIFSQVWTRSDREAYKYLFDLMKPEEKKPLQAARTAFFKVEEWRKRGLLDR